MSSKKRPRRGRPIKGEERLSRGAIVEAALSVLDEQGIEALSMRAVATELGVDAKSLYNHVTNKEGLLDALAEHVLTHLAIAPATGCLEDDLRTLARAFRAANLAHPRAATLVLTRQLSSPASLLPTEHFLSVLQHAGLDPARSVHVLRTLLATMIGTLLRELHAPASFGTADTEGIAQRQWALEAAALPHLAASAAHLARCDHAAEYEFAVELLIVAVRRLARAP